MADPAGARYIRTVERVSQNLLFVCTGNICRSPMAEAFARDYGQRRGIPLQARSASMIGLHDQPAHKNAIRAMAEVGIDLSNHVAQPVTGELVEWADWILGMEVCHVRWLRETFPEAEARVALLGSYGGMFEIPDPLGGWMGRFRRSRDQIRRCVENLVDRLPPAPPPR